MENQKNDPPVMPTKKTRYLSPVPQIISCNKDNVYFNIALSYQLIKEIQEAIKDIDKSIADLRDRIF